MNKKIIAAVCAGFFFSMAAVCQTVLFINAGSRASYGQQQELLVDANGNCRYRLGTVNGPVKDSSSFALLPGQLDSLFRKAVETGFFSLQHNYDGGAADGAGIYISMNHAGQQHYVQLKNTDVPAINQFITLLNTMLAPRQIRINYGQFVPPRPR